jgi:hypothetical protein
MRAAELRQMVGPFSNSHMSSPWRAASKIMLTLGRGAAAAKTVECDRIKAILGIKSGISSGRDPRGMACRELTAG